MTKQTITAALLLALGTAAAQGEFNPLDALDRTSAWEFQGRIFYLGANYCPPDSLPADGRQLSIEGYRGLYKLLGMRFGGDGQGQFALPRHAAPGGLTACIAISGNVGPTAAIPPNGDPLVSQVVYGPCEAKAQYVIPADGRVLPSSLYLRLYSLIGDRFGSKGPTNFAVPVVPGACISLDGKYPPRP